MTIGVSARWLCFVGVAVGSMGCSASHGTVADASVDASSACRRHTDCPGSDPVGALGELAPAGTFVGRFVPP